jgi:hypothetical protein
MAVVNKMELGRELFKTISQLNLLVDEVRKNAERNGVDPLKAHDDNGNWTMIPLIAAKAQCLHALAIINQKDR